jgi:hypothetical protein
MPNTRVARAEDDALTLEGTWKVIRTGGLLPPLPHVYKRIQGERGETRVVGLPAVPFSVEGLELRYRRPFSSFVDVLLPNADGGYDGRATFRGRELGRFVLRRPG